MCRLIYSKEIRTHHHKPTNWFSKRAKECPRGDSMEKGMELGGAAAAPVTTCATANTTVSVSQPCSAQAHKAQPLGRFEGSESMEQEAQRPAWAPSSYAECSSLRSTLLKLGNSEIFSEIKIVRNICQSIHSAQLALACFVW